MKQEQINKTEEAYKKFQEAKAGYFNGFDFADLFHRDFHKEDAIVIGETDDRADAVTPYGTFHTGYDGQTFYVMNDHPTKVVVFNRSAYIL